MIKIYVNCFLSKLRINSVRGVVVLAKVVRPVGGAVYSVRNAVLKAVGIPCVSHVDRPQLIAVGAGGDIVQRRFLVACPAVGGVSHLDVLFIGKVFEACVNGKAAVVEVVGSERGNRRLANLLGGVVLAVVVVPNGYAVGNILDRIFGVVAGDVCRVVKYSASLSCHA